MRLIIILLFTISTAWGANLKPIFKQVSKEYKVSYELLSKIAWLESGHKPRAKARTTSSRGLFQITKATERVLRRKCKVKGSIYNARVNTRLGACLIKMNGKSFRRKMKRRPSNLESYLMHFLGLSKGIKFIRRANHESAVKGFKREARANKWIFYRRGKARTVGQVKWLFQRKLDKARVL